MLRGWCRSLKSSCRCCLCCANGQHVWKSTGFKCKGPVTLTYQPRLSDNQQLDSHEYIYFLIVALIAAPASLSQTRACFVLSESINIRRRDEIKSSVRLKARSSALKHTKRFLTPEGRRRKTKGGDTWVLLCVVHAHIKAALMRRLFKSNTNSHMEHTVIQELIAWIFSEPYSVLIIVMNINAIRVLAPLSQHQEMSCNERMREGGEEAGRDDSPGCWTTQPLTNSGLI